MNYKHLHTLLFLVLLSFGLNAQQYYPVKVEGIIKGSVASIDDLSNPLLLGVNVALKDLQRPSIEVEVKASITYKGQSYVSTGAIGMKLYAGVVSTLSYQEQKELFTFNSGAALGSEGIYTITYTAIEKTSKIPVSNSATDFSIVNILSINAPTLIYPINKQKLSANIPVSFSWNAPPQAYAANSDILYEFTLVKIDPSNRNPNEAIQSSNTLSGTSVFSGLRYNNLLYDNTASPLELGVSYAWQVQAYSPAGNDKDTKRFVNNGRSEVNTFSLTEQDCVSPMPTVEIVTQELNPQAIIKWNTYGNHQTYELKYRRYATYDPWTIVQLDNTQTSYTLDQSLIELNVDYEYTLATRCIGWQNPVFGQNFKLTGELNTETSTCPAPKPEALFVESTQNSADTKEAKVIWASKNVYKSYEFIWWDALTPNTKASITTTVPQAIITPITNDVLYNYQVKYTCSDNTVIDGPVKGFRLDSEVQLNIEQGTADCFPPAEIRAEAVSTTTANFEWDRISSAKDYQLFYAIEGTQDYKVFNTTGDFCKIKDLQEGASYTYKVRCRCGSDYSIFSKEAKLDMTAIAGKNCDSIPLVELGTITANEVQLKWSVETITPRKYNIHYKEESQPWSKKYTQVLEQSEDLKSKNPDQTLNLYTINNLKPNTSYQFQLEGVCGTDKAVPNTILTASTLKGQSNDDCGSADICDRTSKTPITADKIAVGSVIDIYDFTLKIETLTASANNKYNGTGTTTMAILNKTDNVTLKVSFTDLQVNDKNCVTNGKVDATGVDNAVTSAINKLNDAVKATSTALGDASNALDQAQVGIAAAQKAGVEYMNRFQGGNDTGIPITGGLGEFASTKTEDGVPVTTPNADYAGANNGAGIDVANLKIDKEAPQVTFATTSGAKYAFDVFQDKYGTTTTLMGKYLKIDGTYYSAKAITPGATDNVKVTFASGLNKADVHFINRKGDEYKVMTNVSGSTADLLLLGGPANDAQEILAVTGKGENMKVHGALLLASYPTVTKKVLIIPVGTDVKVEQSQADQLQTKLNTIFNPIGITYQVSVAESLKDKWQGAGNRLFSPSGSTLLGNDYTGDEKTVIDYYSGLDSFDASDNTTAYVFAIGSTINNGSGDEGGLQGKMNFKKQFGFLYGCNTMANTDLKGRVLAHELCHGGAYLYHIFDDIYLGETAKYNNNLMSYSENPSATELMKVQWDAIHDPGEVWGLLAKDKDQEIGGYAWKIQNIIDDIRANKSKTSFSFINKNGRYNENPTSGNPRTFVFGGVTYQAVDVSVKFNAAVDLTKCYISIVDEYSTIKIAYRNSSSEDIAWIKLKKLFDVDGYSKAVGATAITTTAATKVITTLTELANNTIKEDAEGLAKYTSACAGMCRDIEFKALNITVRTKCLSNIIYEDKYWTNSGLNLLAELVKHTPKTDQIVLLKNGFAANNYDWIAKLSDQITEYKDLTDDKDLALFYGLAEVLNQFIGDNWAQLGIKPVVYQYLDLSIKDMLFFDFHPGQDNFYIGSEINRIYNLFQGFNVSFVASHNPYTVVFNNTTGKVELSQEYKYIDTKTYVSKPGSILPDRSIPTVYQAAYNPFEPVTITFAKNYPSLGYDAGYTAVVPAYYAILLNRSIESKNIDDNVRHITNGIQVSAALATAPFTGGTSLATIAIFTTRVAGLASALDSEILKEKNALSASEYTENIALYDAWDTFKATVDFAELGAGTAVGLSKLPAAIENLNKIRSWKRFNAVCTNNNSTYTAKVRNAWKSVKDGTVITVNGAGNLIQTATKAITKTRLPNDFMNALKAFGKTEDDILEYFTKYHNDNGFRFLNEAEDLVTQFPTLTKGEAYSLWGYTTDNFYFELNDWLRRGVNASKTQGLKNILTSALGKVPKYNGTAFRAIKLEGQALTAFLSKHNVGDIVTYDEFVSCGSTQTAAFFNKPGKNIQLTMEVNNAPIISDFADGIKFRNYSRDELLLLPGKQFKILSKELDNGIYKISVVQQ